MIEELTPQAQAFVMAWRTFRQPGGLQPTVDTAADPVQAFCMACDAKNVGYPSDIYWDVVRSAGLQAAAKEALLYLNAEAAAEIAVINAQYP